MNSLIGTAGLNPYGVRHAVGRDGDIYCKQKSVERRFYGDKWKVTGDYNNFDAILDDVTCKKCLKKITEIEVLLRLAQR